MMYDKAGLNDVFRCKTIAFIGDSIVRLLSQRLIRDLDKAAKWFQNDYHYHIPESDIQIDFFWQPRVRAEHAHMTLVLHQYCT